MFNDFVTFFLQCPFVFVCVIIVSYLLGSINFSIILSKSIDNKDIRESGSGNAGATNVLRSYGKKAAVLTLLGDALKSIVAVFFAKGMILLFANPEMDTLLLKIISGYMAGLFCVIGHLYPVWFGFRGGKGVSTTLGLSIALDLRIAVIGLLIFGIVVIVTRYVSFGSICAGIVMVVSTFFMQYYVSKQTFNISIITTISLGICVFLVILKHTPNIKRLINGTENKISWNKIK